MGVKKHLHMPCMHEAWQCITSQLQIMHHTEMFRIYGLDRRVVTGMICMAQHPPISCHEGICMVKQHL